MSEKYQIKEATESDEKDIQFLWSEVFKIVSPTKRYNWLYKSSPLKPLTYIAIDTDSNLTIGMSALYLNEYYSKGNKCVVAIAADFGVLPKYRVFGPAKLLQRNIISAVEMHRVDVILAYPNKKAAKLMQSVGYSTIGKTTICVKYIDGKEIIEKLLKLRLLSLVASKVYRFLIYLFDIILSIIFFRHKIQVFNSIDELIKNGSCLTDDTHYTELTKVKDLRYLKWRFEVNPVIKSPMIIAIKRRNADIYGIAIAIVSDKKLVILDIIGITKNIDYLALLNKISIYARSNHYTAIQTTFTGGNSFRYMLVLNGFTFKYYDRELMVYPPEYKNILEQNIIKSPMFECDMDF